MKTIPAAALIILALTLSGAARAEGYIGGAAGIMDADISGDNPFNAGVRGGYEWPNRWGVEGEITKSISDGKADLGVFGKFNYSLDTYAAYATYRTDGDVYFKGRLGFLDEEVDAGPVDGGDSGLSGGAGVGVKLRSNLEVQFEYTFIEKDVNFWSGSVIVRF